MSQSKQPQTQEMKFDFDGLIQLLAKNLYSEKRVFIRELIQNAHDAVVRRRAREGDAFQGKISIETNPDELQFVIRDTGIGMNQNDLNDYLSTIGKGATRVSRQEDKTEGLIGLFGIGFLSAFVVAERVEVITRRLGETEGWRWCNSGNKDYTIEPYEVKEIGTIVTVFLRGEEEKGVIHKDEVQKVIRRYADFLRVPIYLNNSTNPINEMQMPWEQGIITERTFKKSEAMAESLVLSSGIGTEKAYSLVETGPFQTSSEQGIITKNVYTRVYLETTMRDSVLEMILINLPKLGISGVLYITRWRAVQHKIPQTIRLFVNRMFICEKENGLVPEWAQFINGILCISDQTLTLTASRDNFMRDKKLEELQSILGDVIINHLEKLSKDDPKRFSEILRYHDLSIKAACYYYYEFFDKFAELLEWRTNQGYPTSYAGDFTHVWRTLSQILEQLPKAEGEPQSLPYFSDTNSANQYFQMADAAHTLVVDASYNFEQKLIKAYAERAKGKIKLVPVDREDDPNVFQKLDYQADVKIKMLAEFMSQMLRPGGIKVRVEANYFEPKELSALIRSTEATEGLMKAREILDDPDSSGSLREMAQEMMRMSRDSSLRLVLNAGNPLIRQIAKQNFSNPDIQNIMLGIYNSAILYNQELMTPQNARVFYEAFQNLLSNNLTYLTQQDELNRQKEELEKQRQAEQKRHSKTEQLKHLIFFLITPFDNSYQTFIENVREVIENRFGCQLFVSKDAIIENVHHYMDQAHAFIAEVTDANPHVMFELGAAMFDLRERPIVLMRKTKDKQLPVDLQGRIYFDYDNKEGDTLIEFLETQLQTDERIKSLLNKAGRERYISPKFLQGLKFPFNIDKKAWQSLADCYPTKEAWLKADVKKVTEILGKDNEDFAEPVLKRIKRELSD